MVGLLAGCGEAPPEHALAPSPLVDTGPVRLWILIRASRIGDGRECVHVYLDSSQASDHRKVRQCARWTERFAEYLNVNGLSNVTAAHLQTPSYWEWYLAKRRSIADCRAAVGTLSVTANGDERAQHARRRAACDPYDDALNNQALGPAQLGIRYP